MHILFADNLDRQAVTALEEAGHQVECRPELTAADLWEAIGAADALVVRSTKVPAAAIEASAALSLIVRAGAGTENIDMDAASAQGVHVCNVPGRNAVAVAELTIGLLLAVDRHIAHATADLRSGVWNKATYSKAEGLMGRTIAIVGLGEIGLQVAERAKAFGLTVLGLRRPNRSAEAEARIRSIGIRLVDTMPELVAAADVVSIHVPAAESTHHLVDAELLDHFQDGAILLNTSRGDCVDEGALLNALGSKGLRAGLDVFQGEPGAADHVFQSELARHPAVVGTHHVGASTAQAQRSIAAGVVETVEAFVLGTPLNCVNLAERDAGAATVTVRHYDRVGVLAAVFGVLRGAGLNVQHMENRVFVGRIAALAAIDVSAPPDAEILERLREVPDVLGVSVLEAVT